MLLRHRQRGACRGHASRSSSISTTWVPRSPTPGMTNMKRPRRPTSRVTCRKRQRRFHQEQVPRSPLTGMRRTQHSESWCSQVRVQVSQHHAHHRDHRGQHQVHQRSQQVSKLRWGQHQVHQRAQHVSKMRHRRHDRGGSLRRPQMILMKQSGSRRQHGGALVARSSMPTTSS